LREVHQAQQNVGEASNVVDIADGATQSISQDLQRIRELTIQASNGTQSPQSRQAIATEISQLSQNIDQTAQAARWNGKSLLDGTANLSINTGNGQTQTIAPGNATTDAAGGGLGLGLFDQSGATATFKDAQDLATQLTGANASQFLNDVDHALQQASTIRVNLGTAQTQLNSTMDSLSVQAQNTASALSTTQDTDVAAALTEMTQNRIIEMAQIAIEAQTNKTLNKSLSLLSP
jgi:flagellin